MSAVRASTPDRCAGRAGDGGEHQPAVLVGVDDSPTSWHAFEWACGEARRLDGRVLAVLVSSRTQVMDGVSAAVLWDLDASLCLARADAERQRAREIGDQVRRRGVELGVPVSFSHLWGRPARGLAGLAMTERVDVIAVGRSTRAIHHLAGSVGRRLASAGTPGVVVIVP